MQNDIIYEWKTVGHYQVKRLLDLQVQNNSVAQSYLFLGPQGVGKRALAEEFATRLTEGNTAVLRFSFAESGVEELRQLLESISFRPLVGSRQFVILDGVEDMQAATSNALLKTLEEPGPSTTLILVSSQNSVPATVVSRCQRMQFGKLTASERMQLSQQLGADGGVNDRVIHEVWNADIKKLISSSAFQRLVCATAWAGEEVAVLEQRIQYWLNYFADNATQPELLAKRLRVLQDSFDRLQKNGNRKLVMQYLCLNI